MTARTFLTILLFLYGLLALFGAMLLNAQTESVLRGLGG